MCSNLTLPDDAYFNTLEVPDILEKLRNCSFFLLCSCYIPIVLCICLRIGITFYYDLQILY